MTETTSSAFNKLKKSTLDFFESNKYLSLFLKYAMFLVFLRPLHQLLQSLLGFFTDLSMRSDSYFYGSSFSSYSSSGYNFLFSLQSIVGQFYLLFAVIMVISIVALIAKENYVPLIIFAGLKTIIAFCDLMSSMFRGITFDSFTPGSLFLSWNNLGYFLIYVGLLVWALLQAKKSGAFVKKATTPIMPTAQQSQTMYPQATPQPNAPIQQTPPQQVIYPEQPHIVQPTVQAPVETSQPVYTVPQPVQVSPIEPAQPMINVQPPVAQQVPAEPVYTTPVEAPQPIYSTPQPVQVSPIEPAQPMTNVQSPIPQQAPIEPVYTAPQPVQVSPIEPAQPMTNVQPPVPQQAPAEPVYTPVETPQPVQAIIEPKPTAPTKASKSAKKAAKPAEPTQEIVSEPVIVQPETESPDFWEDNSDSEN